MNWFPLCFGCFLWNNCRFLLSTKFRLKQDWSVSASFHFLMKIYFLLWWDTCWDNLPVKSSRVDLENSSVSLLISVIFCLPMVLFFSYSEFSLMKCSQNAFPISVIILQWKNHPPKNCPFYPFPQKRFWLVPCRGLLPHAKVCTMGLPTGGVTGREMGGEIGKLRLKLLFVAS